MAASQVEPLEVLLRPRMEHLRDRRRLSGLPPSVERDEVSRLPPVVAAFGLVPANLTSKHRNDNKLLLRLRSQRPRVLTCCALLRCEPGDGTAPNLDSCVPANKRHRRRVRNRRRCPHADFNIPAAARVWPARRPSLHPCSVRVAPPGMPTQIRHCAETAFCKPPDRQQPFGRPGTPNGLARPGLSPPLLQRIQIPIRAPHKNHPIHHQRRREERPNPKLPVRRQNRRFAPPRRE